MRLRASLPEIPIENPFANCKLNREPYAKILTSAIENTEGGFSMALNGSWGSGKSTFIRMWQQYMRNKGFVTAYINAWENDFIKNPMAVILGEINSFNRQDKKRFKKLINSLPKSLLLGVEEYIYARTGIDGKPIKHLFKRHKSYDNDIDTYKDQTAALKEFRSELQEYVTTLCNNKPLILFIDELDRCRPDYAVEFLERMKHFFSVDNIIFIISVDKKHLAESIKGHYGSENIDTDEYLRRFFDVEYDLPHPNTTDFCKYLYEKENLDGINENLQKGYLLDIILMLVHTEDITLRQIERYFGQLKLCFACYKELVIWPDLCAFMIMHKIFHPEIYEKIKSSFYNLDSLSEWLSDKYGQFLEDEKDIQAKEMTSLLANIIVKYNGQLRANGAHHLLIRDTLNGTQGFNFKIYKLPPKQTYNTIQYIIEKMKDEIQMSDIYHLIDLSLPFNNDIINEANNKEKRS